MIRTLPKDKIIITVAMTGALVTKEQHPDLPVSPDEIAENAKACVEEGAAICHFHFRLDVQFTHLGQIGFDFVREIAKGGSLVLPGKPHKRAHVQ